MKVLVLLHDSYGALGGIAKFNRDLLAALDRDPRVSEIVVLPRTRPTSAAGLPRKVRFRRMAPGRAGFLAGALIERLRRGTRPALVIAAHIRLLPAALLARPSDSRLWLIVHGIDAWQPQRQRWDRRLLAEVDQIISVSQFTRERMRSWAGLEAERFRILPNCVDLAAFAPGPPEPELVRRYDLSGRTVLLTLARLAGQERYKGIDEVIEALPRLAKELPGIAYLIVGDGPDRPRLQAKAAALGMAERVRFAGAIAEEEKASHYRLADAFVMPGRGEGFGIVYLEALACGIPVVGSTLDGSREALQEGRLGVLVDPLDPSSLHAGICRALRTPKGVPAGLKAYSREQFDARVARLLDEVAP